MLRSFNKKILVALAIVSGGNVCATAQETVSYTPEFHGTLRPRMEFSTVDNAHRFQLRNARLSVNGFVAPFIDYYIQGDVCDRGDMKILDGWVRLAVTNNFKFQSGQFRMPFGVDPFRGPHTYIFANRSFIGKNIFNYRAVGAKIAYRLPQIPLTLEAGAFNPSKIGDHTPWNETFAFASKAVYRLDNVSFATGFASIRPGASRMNAIDGAVTWKSGRWLAEGEYMNTWYANRGYKHTHSYNAYVDYHLPVEAGVFNQLSFQGRFDGMTDFSNGLPGDNGKLTANTPACNRVTIGTTISYNQSENRFLDIRANYEASFYHSDVIVTPDMGDKLVVEMVLRF